MRITPRWRGRLLFALAIYATFFGGTFFTNLDPQQSAIAVLGHHVLLTIVLAAWLVNLLARRRSWPMTPLDVPLAALLVAALVSTLFAQDPRVGIEQVWTLGTHVLMFYAVVDFLRRTKPRTVFEPIFLVATVVILVAVMEMTSWYFGVPPLQYFSQSWFSIGGISHPFPPTIHRLAFTMQVSTTISAYMAVLIPVAVAWMVSSTSSETRRGLFLWLIGAAVVEILTFSRGGLLSLAASLPTLAALLLIGSAGWREQIAGLLRDRWVQGGLALVGLFAVLLAILWAWQTNLAGHQAGDLARFDLWQSAWQIGLHDPLTGAGVGSFGRAMRPYRDPRWTRDGYTSPHNVPLLIWAEEGIVGVAALAACVVILFLTALRRWKTADGGDRIRTAGCVAALVGFTAHNLFDTYVNTTPVMLPVFAIVAYVVSPFDKPIATRIERWIPRLALVSLVVGQVGWFLSDLAQIHFARSIALMDVGQLSSALEEINTARALDPLLGLYAAQRAQILGRMASDDDRYVGDALVAYEEALGFEETYDLLHANYAGLLAHSGELRMALVHMRRAEAIQPGIAQYDFWIGNYSERLGEDEAAREAYYESLTDNWSFAVSEYWAATSLRSEVRDSFLAEQGLDRLSLAEMAVIPAYCWPYVPPADANHGGTAELHCGGEYELLIAGDSESAIRAANFVLNSDPANGPAFALRGEAYLRLGDLEIAERDARTAIFLGDARGYYVLGQIAEEQDKYEAAEDSYVLGAPVVTQSQEWDVAVYGRRGSLSILPLRELDAPGPTRYDFASWFALARLYEQLDQADNAERVYQAIRALDPFPTDSGLLEFPESGAEWLIRW